MLAITRKAITTSVLHMAKGKQGFDSTGSDTKIRTVSFNRTYDNALNETVNIPTWSVDDKGLQGRV